MTSVNRTRRAVAFGPLAAMALGLSGCAYYRDSRDPPPTLREVGIVEWDEPGISLVVVSPGEQAAMYVGSALLLGGVGVVGTTAFVAGASGTPVARLNEALQKQRPWLAATLREQLVAAGDKRGVRVVGVAMPENAKTDIYLSGAPDFSGLPTRLLLVVRPWFVGYANSGSRFEPAADIAVTLMTRNHEIYYHRRFGYGAVAAGPRAIHVPSDPKFHFASTGELISQPERAVEGLRAAAAPIVDVVVKELGAKGALRAVP